MTSILGPRNFGDIIGEAFRIYGRNFLKLLAIVAIVEVILVVLGTILNFSLWQPIYMYIMSGGNIEFLAPFIGTFIVMGIILLVSYIVAYPLMTGALVHAVSEQYLRQTLSIGQAYGFAWRRLLAMIGAGILAFLAVAGIIAICISVATFSWVGWICIVIGIVAAVYLMIGWIFLWQAALLEGLGPIAALSRSWALVKGNWWRVFGIMLVVGLIAGAISAILGIIPVVGGIIGSILSIPIAITSATLLYYDLRVRKEGYSLEALAEELHIKINGDVA